MVSVAQVLCDFRADMHAKNDDDETPMSITSSVRIHRMFSYEPPAAEGDPSDESQPFASNPKMQRASRLLHLGDEGTDQVSFLPRRARNEDEPAANPHQLPGLPKRRRRNSYGGVPFHKAQPIYDLYSRRFEHKSPLVVAGLQMSRADSGQHLADVFGLPADSQSESTKSRRTSRRMSGYASGIAEDEQPASSSKKKAMRVSSYGFKAFDEQPCPFSSKKAKRVSAYGFKVQPDRKKKSAAMRVSAYGLPQISTR
jgi:hypothetical protein